MVMPENIAQASRPIISSVLRAFLAFGLRNAGTPLAMASTPVSAVHPDEKARSAKKINARVPMFAYPGCGMM
jgi:hypothetical protein